MKKRKNYTPEFKTKIVLEMLKEEKTISQISSEYGVHPTQLNKWRQQFTENMANAFSKEASEVEKLKKEYDSKEEDYLKQIGQLTIEVNWLKKKSGYRYQ